MSVERLRSTGFAHNVQVHAQYIFNDFSQVFEELGAVVHLLDFDGEGLVDRWSACLRTENTGLHDMIQGLMTVFAFVTYESGFESLVREGCEHVACLTSFDFDTNKNLYTDVGEVAGVAAEEMLDCMWSPFSAGVAHKRSVAML